MTADPTPSDRPLPADWRPAIDAIGRAILDGDEVEVGRALAVWMPRLDDADAEQRVALGRCHGWSGTLALRRGEHFAAMRSFAGAVMRLDPDGAPFPHVHARTQLAVAMSSLGLHTEGLSMAAQAASFGLAHGLHAEAAQALMVVGLCAVLLGDPFLGERYALEALGIGLAEGLDPLVRWATTNLVYLVTALAEQQRERGDAELAEQSLRRAVRHVHRGERLGYPPGSFEETLFRSNRAGWLALRGRLDEAVAAWTAVADAARAGGWVEIERHAAFGLGRLAADRGDADAAGVWFARCVDAGTGHDAYRVVERAHRRLADLAEGAGDLATARRHRVAAQLQGRQSEARRRRAAAALGGLDENLLLALSDADQVRLDSALDRLHETLPFPASTAYD